MNQEIDQEVVCIPCRNSLTGYCNRCAAEIDDSEAVLEQDRAKDQE